MYTVCKFFANFTVNGVMAVGFNLNNIAVVPTYELTYNPLIKPPKNQPLELPS